LVKLKLALLNAKIALIKNKHDHNYSAYTKEYLFKLKIAVLKLQIALIKNPFIFGHHFDFDVKDLLEIIVHILDIRNGFTSPHFGTNGKRISHGLPWVHEQPKFDTDDVLALTVALLKEKADLFKLDCIKHGFHHDLGWTDHDLESITISIIKLKIQLMKNPHAFFPKLVLKIKVLEELLDLVKEVTKIKNKLKPCSVLFELKFDHHGRPLFDSKDLNNLVFALLKFKKELMDRHVTHQFKDFTIKYLKGIQLGLLQLKIFMIKNPHVVHINFEINDLLELIKEIIDLKRHQPSHPILGHLDVGNDGMGLDSGSGMGLDAGSGMGFDDEDENDIIATPEPTPWRGNGRCSDDFDQLIKTWNLRHVTKRCAQDVCHGDESCVARCVGNKTQVSHNCTTCFGEFVRCALNKCWWKCMFGSDDDCQRCADDECTKSFEKCAFGDWEPDWKTDMGFVWKWDDLFLETDRRRMPFEGMDIFTKTQDAN